MPKDNSGKETGWISPHAFQANALSSNERGRQAMQDGYVTLAKLDRYIIDRIALIRRLDERLKAIENAIAGMAKKEEKGG